MPRRLALLIGNTVYDDAKLRRLRAPSGDLEALATVLRTGELGGFDVTVLLNRSTTEVTMAIAKFFKDRDRGDLLMFYFSGHGVLDEFRNLYFATKNTDLEIPSGSAIAASFVNTEMEHCRAKKQVMLLDCCHGGAFVRGIKAPALGQPVGTDSIFASDAHGRVVLTATDATQYAFEGEQVLGITDRSVFTHFLVEGLQTGDADLNGDGRITADEVYSYVQHRVREAGAAQSPMKWTFGQTGDIVLARNPKAVEPADGLPSELRGDVASAHEYRRRGALGALRAIVLGRTPDADAARRLLQQMSRQDPSPEIRGEAAAVLEGLTARRAPIKAEPPLGRTVLSSPSTPRPLPVPPLPASVPPATQNRGSAQTAPARAPAVPSLFAGRHPFIGIAVIGTVMLAIVIAMKLSPSGKPIVTKGKEELPAARPAEFEPPTLVSLPAPVRELPTVIPSQADIIKVISKSRGGIKFCYQEALTRDNTLTRGKLSVKVSIGISGRVKHVGVEGPSQFLLLLEPCIKEVVQRWVFPRASEEYGAEFPLVFQGDE